MHTRHVRQVKTVLICLGFSLLPGKIGAPLPFLFGSLFGCLFASLVGIQLAGIPIVSSVSRTALGVAIGTTLTMEVITTIPNYIPTLLIIPLYIFLISPIGYPFLEKSLNTIVQPPTTPTCRVVCRT